jgi:uncharacterized protein YjiS (DUF1127 family)
LYQYKSQEAAMIRSEIRSQSLPRGAGIVMRFVSALHAALTRRRDRNILAQLDSHLLRDIGLSPDEAKTECAKPFWRA